MDPSVAGIGTGIGTSVEILNTSPYQGKLIAGIQFGGTPDDVRRKLKKPIDAIGATEEGYKSSAW
jgi:hypothetical protein